MSLSLAKRVRVIRVETPEDREHAISVLRETYAAEKHWIQSPEEFFPLSDLEDASTSWFLTFVDTKPVGVLRVMYNPPLELYKTYGFKQLDNGIDIEAFVSQNRIAEIGRFAVLPEYRRFVVVVAALMRSASKETIERDYSHYVTDIFEGETHSPYEFHTRVMGFKPVATHDVGELNCPNRRITMLLDLKEAYERIRTSQKWIYRFLTRDWDASLHDRLRKSS